MPFNNKLESFISPFPHPRAPEVDTLGVNWNQWVHVCTFPLRALLQKVAIILEKFVGSAGKF